MSFEQRDHWGGAMLHMRPALVVLASADAPAVTGARLAQALDALQRELDRLPRSRGAVSEDRTGS